MGLSIWQLLIILLIVVLLFGANRIPRLMGDVGKGIRSFRSGLKEGEEDGAEQSADGERRVGQDGTEPVNRATDASASTTTRSDETARSS